MSATMAPLQTVAPQPASGGSYQRLQRRCASCGKQSSQGECEECQAKGRGVQAKLVVSGADDPYEREADALAARVMSTTGAAHGPLAVQRLRESPASSGETIAPPAVDHVIASPGQALDPGARAFLEPRFGHDFSHVRVHHDGSAARSAASVNARAYTVGEHVVFGAGEYAPATRGGRALLAHELSHVLQQRPVVQRASIGGAPVGVSGSGQTTEDEDKEEGQVMRVQRLVTDSDPTGSGWAEKDEASEIRAQDAADRECVRVAGADPLECDPATPLSWSDFAGTPPASTFSAETASGLRERAINIADRQCRPSWAPPNQPARGVQAFFDGAASWVQPQFNGNPAQNGCAQVISDCTADFAAGNTGFHMNAGPVAGCGASIRAAGTPATTAAQCTTVVGADCNTTRAAESARLLNHEQWHFNLSCAMARKANAMLATAPDFPTLLAAAQRTLATQQSLYDTQTRHGCNAGPQATWQTAIAAGLPAVTINLTAAAAPRRRRRT